MCGFEGEESVDALILVCGVTECPQLSQSELQSLSKKKLLRKYVEKIILHPIEITLFKKWMKIVDKNWCQKTFVPKQT